VFIRSHLVRAETTSDFMASFRQGYDQGEREFIHPASTRDLEVQQVYNPGDLIVIHGYFLDNSESGQVYLRLSSETEVAFTEPCTIVSALTLKC
jgi:hypothetical protein